MLQFFPMMYGIPRWLPEFSMFRKNLQYSTFVADQFKVLVRCRITTE